MLPFRRGVALAVAGAAAFTTIESALAVFVVIVAVVVVMVVVTLLPSSPLPT